MLPRTASQADNFADRYRQDHRNRQNSIDDLDGEKKAIYLRRIGSLFAEPDDLYREMVTGKEVIIPDQSLSISPQISEALTLLI